MRYTNGSIVQGILDKLKKQRMLPLHQLKINGEFVRRPEPAIDLLRKQGWNIDTYRLPKKQGKGSVYFLNEDPSELIDKGYEPLFMAQAKAAKDVRYAPRTKIQSIFDKRNGDQELRYGE